MQDELCAGLLATVVSGCLLLRQGLRWGATDEEVHTSLPGDEIVLHHISLEAHHESTARARQNLWPKRRDPKSASGCSLIAKGPAGTRL